ncbi:MAG: hypothetical protein PUP91_31380 [Rhizonema sp. PD37]|nr:hypothetical protein [Rhizonema sp. PD37]
MNNFAELSVELTQELLEEIESQEDRFDLQTRENITEILENLSQNSQKVFFVTPSVLFYNRDRYLRN